MLRSRPEAFRKLFFFFFDKDRTAYLKAVLKRILDDRSVLCMTAYGLLYTVLLSRTGIEDHLAVFNQIELTVGRETILFRQVVPAGSEDLCIRMGTEASAADTVDRTLRCALQRMIESDAVTDEKVRIVVRARSRRAEITDQFAALVEFSAPFGSVLDDRRSLRKDLLSFRILRLLGYLTVAFQEETERSSVFTDQDGFLFLRRCADICIDVITSKKCGTDRSRERESGYAEYHAAIQSRDVLGTYRTITCDISESLRKHLIRRCNDRSCSFTFHRICPPKKK